MAIVGRGTHLGPDAAAWDYGRIYVFVRGTDNALWHRRLEDDRWSGWESLGGQLTSAPGACSLTYDRLYVFVRGTDNAVWYIVYDGQWGGWRSLGGQIASGLDAAAWRSGHYQIIDVHARGVDNTLLHKRYVLGWKDWRSLGGQLTSDPGAVDDYVFVRGTDNALWYTTV